MNNLFSDYGFIIDNIRHLSAREAFEAIEKGAILIDLRDEYLTEMKIFDVSNYIICPLKSLSDNLGNLPADKPLIVADSTGLYSKKAVIILAEAGFNVTNLAGGIMDWERDGFPVIKNPSNTLSGQCPCMLKPMNKIKKK